MLYFSKLRITIIALCCLAGVLFALPNLFTEKQLQSWPSFLPKQQLVLGLDLRGGAHLVLQVDTETFVKDQLEIIRGDVRRLLRKARIGYTGGLKISGNSIKTRIRDPEKYDEARKLLRSLVQPVNTGVIGRNVYNVTVYIGKNGTTEVSMTEKAVELLSSQVIEQAMEVLRSRIDALGTTEPLLVRQGPNRLLVEVPGHSDTTQLKEILRRTAKMTFHLVEEIGELALSETPSRDSLLLYTKSETDDQARYPILVNKTPLLSGSDLVNAKPQFDNDTNRPVVHFRFNAQGAKKFASITRQNVGQMLAIVLDGEVITYPRIEGPIPGGSGVISGNFTTQSASDLALLLRTGALPTDLSILEERVVGASLGADSILAGKIATLVGTIGVAVFMVLAYGIMGVFANLAVILNMIFTIAILSALGSTLTLPGIAGIVLGVGMAVDANVLIYERIREEQLLGRDPVGAIEAGFTKVLATIFDANSTHVLAALVLFYFGTGPIKGFALTLTICIISSYFTAVSITRLFVAQWLHWVRPQRIPL